MTEERNPFIVMSWSSESDLLKSGDPDDFIYETSGDLFSVDDNDGRELVSKFRFYYVDVERAIHEGMPLFDVFDAHSHIVEYYDAVSGSNAPDFSDRLIKLLNHDVLGSNVLILDRLEIPPQYRGSKLGLRTMGHMIRRFAAGAAVVAIKPLPLQLEVEPSGEDEQKWRTSFLAQLPKDKRVAIAIKKLCDYYTKLGFLRISRTPFMIRATAWPIPEAESV
jgi:hypothetical protein